MMFCLALIGLWLLVSLVVGLGLGAFLDRTQRR
jgi:hypothetical protein